MNGFFDFFNTDNKNRDEENEENQEEAGTLKLRKEELDLNKNRIKSGDVELGKEIIEEQKTIDVPVTHEEVVIERRSLNNEVTDAPITDEETIHIPVSEEQVTADKYTVLTGEVTARKREVQETRRIDESLKREEARIHSSGNATVIDKDTDDGFR